MAGKEMNWTDPKDSLNPPRLPPYIYPRMPEQQLTIRYVRHILTYGSNPRFHLAQLARDISIQDNVVVGSFYRASLIDHANGDDRQQEAIGTTPEHAVQRALEKFGLTFRA